MAPGRILIVDANVLIDYVSTDETVLTLASAHLGDVMVPSPVLGEVDALDEADCHRLGLRLVDPTLEQLLEAGSQRGRLSFEDHVCLIIARDNGWTCVTSDGRLRTACIEAGIEVMWSLDLLVALVRAEALPADDAIAIASDLHRLSPQFITDAILADFALALSQ
jgi:rRNA-processing protein FCF1